MPTKRKPRDGSLQFKPRKRAKKETPRVRSWPNSTELKPLAFAGYKVGMTHVILTDNKSTSITKGENISVPVTIVECPPIKIASVVFYKNSSYGLKTIASIFSKKLDKELKKKIAVPKEFKKNIGDIKPEEYDDVRILVYTQPKLTTIGKKKPELFEIALGGKKEEKMNWINENIEKDLNVQDVLNPGQLVDIHAVTKGKGLQGPMRRDGISLKSHKSQKSRRKAVLGPEGYAKVQFTAHQSGQLGYHLRMEHNKWIIKIDSNTEEVNNKSGFKRYGVIKNPYVLIKGSVHGASKRLVMLTAAMKPNKKIPKEGPKISHIVK